MNRHSWIGSNAALSANIMKTWPNCVGIKPLDNTLLGDLPQRFSGVIVDDAHTNITLPHWFPVAKVNQLTDPAFLHHFLLRVMILNDINQSMRDSPTRGAVIAFHSRYKLLLLAHSQPQYREIGPFVAAMATQPIQDFVLEYRERIMTLLTTPSTPENHANVLSHLQGYFRPQLAAQKRQALADLILDYLHQKVTLEAPLNLIKEYLRQFPHPYLNQQAYLKFYPQITTC